MDDQELTPVDILLVEDNPGDIFLTKKAFKSCKLSNRLFVAEDGEKALSFLKKEGENKDAITPDIILLDLNLPGKDGREILSEIKDDEELKKIPVIILTSSEAEIDIMTTYKLHANSYIVKPVDFAKFVDIVSTIENFWFSIVKLPK